MSRIKPLTTTLFSIVLTAAGCAPDAAPRGQSLGGGSADAGAATAEGTLCEPSWSTALRFSDGTEARVGTMTASADTAGLHLTLTSEDPDVGIGDTYAGVGVHGGPLSWTSTNRQPWRDGWRDEVTVDVPAAELAGACGEELKIIVQARAETPSGIQWISAEGPGDMGRWGWYDLRPLCCGPVEPSDADGDGYAMDVDCDDSDAGVNPGADEIPFDGVDQNCDALDHIVVTEHVIDAQRFFDEDQIQMASLPGGTTLLLWVATEGSSAAAFVKVRLVDADGTRGPIVTLSNRSTAVAAGDGRFLLVDSRPDAAGTVHLWGTFMEADGTLGSPFQITDPAGPGGVDPAIAFADGIFVIAYLTLDGGSIGYTLDGILVSETGIIGRQFDISDNPYLGDHEVTSDGDDVLVSWAHSPFQPEPSNPVEYDGFDTDYYGRLIEPLIGPVTPRFDISTLPGAYGHHEVASNGSSYLVVHRMIGTGEGDVHATLLDRLGNVLVPTAGVGLAPSSQWDVDVTTLDGDYLVAFRDDRFDPGNFDEAAVFVQRVSSAGTAIGTAPSDNRLVMATPGGSYESLTVHTNAPDSTLFAWVDPAGTDAHELLLTSLDL